MASSLNYLLSREAILDLLNAEQATILVVPAPHLDAACWSKATGAFDHVPSLKQVVVMGGSQVPDFVDLHEVLSGEDG